MMYFVYIIKSAKDESWHYGFSEDPEKRLGYHNAGKSRYTKGKLPWVLIFQRSFENRTEALKFERQLKRLRNKNYILKIYSEYFL